jgi:hypothetical protein
MNREEKEKNIMTQCKRNRCSVCKLTYYKNCEFQDYSDEEIDEAYSILSDEYTEDYKSTIESMANEIAKYRYPNQYEYSDKQIESIISEFS